MTAGSKDGIRQLGTADENPGSGKPDAAFEGMLDAALRLAMHCEAIIEYCYNSGVHQPSVARAGADLISDYSELRLRVKGLPESGRAATLAELLAFGEAALGAALEAAYSDDEADRRSSRVEAPIDLIGPLTALRAR